MAEVKLQKGNLFNPLTGYFDFNLLNSSEYDLEISIDGKKEYYRIRFKDFKYIATKLKTSSSYEFIKPEGLSHSPKDEVLEFINSDFYKTEYKNRIIMDRCVRENRTRKYSTDESYSNYLASLFQKSSFNSFPLCSFYVDSKNYNDRKDVSGYKVSIENVKNRYYIVFVECIGKETSSKVDNEVLWFIYDREEFLEEKSYFEESVLSITENKEHPLLLTESFALLTGENNELAKNILKQIKKYREYFRTSKIQNFLRRDFEKQDKDSIRNSLIKILGLTTYQEVKFALENNEQFARQLVEYIMNEETDIENVVTESKIMSKTLD